MKAVFASLAIVAISLPVLGFAPQEKEPAKKEEISFEKQIIPILKANCLGCHNKDYNKGGFIIPDKLTEAEALKNPRLWRKAGRVTKSGQMPPKSSNTLGDKDRATFVSYIEAKFPKKPAN